MSEECDGCQQAPCEEGGCPEWQERLVDRAGDDAYMRAVDK